MRIRFLKYVIDFFNKKGTESSKILIQKSIFFLNCSKLNTGYHFEAYKFGPFSTGIMEDAEELALMGEISVEKIEYKKNEDFIADYSDLDTEEIDSLLTDFWENLLNKENEFSKIELIGTVLYVMQNISTRNIENTIEGVNSWKPSKYKKEEITSTFHALEPYFKK